MILNAEGRSNKEVSLEETTAPPLVQSLYADEDATGGLAYLSSPSESPSDSTLALTTVSSAGTDPTTNRVPSPSPVYVHANSIIRNNAEEDLVEEETFSSVVTTPAPPAVSESAAATESVFITTESTVPPRPTPSTLPPFFKSLLTKSSRRADDDGHRVIDALKDIVRQAQKQHAQNDVPVQAPITVTLTNSANVKNNAANVKNNAANAKNNAANIVKANSGNSVKSNNDKSSDNNKNTNKPETSSGYSLPPVAMPLPEDDAPPKNMPGTGLNGDDDDEMEVEVNAGSLDPASSSTDVIDDFAKVVVMVPVEDKSEDDTDTAPSSEVQINRMYKSDIIDELTATILCQHRADIEECGLDMLVYTILASLLSEQKHNTKHFSYQFLPYPLFIILFLFPTVRTQDILIVT